MASIESISGIQPHPNADRLELAQIMGYTCVVPKGEFKVDDKVVFIRPDYVLPESQEWAAGFRKYAPTRIRAIKLRGVFSEGLVVPLDKLPKLDERRRNSSLDEQLGITKYEYKGIDLQNNLLAKSPGLPHSLPKTDEERFENLEKAERDALWGAKCDLQRRDVGRSSMAEAEAFGVHNSGRLI